MTAADGVPPTLSVVVPAFNEEQSIATTVAEIISCLDDPARTELVLVDDGSSDRTLAIMREQVGRRLTTIVVVARATNGGMGEALRTGFANSTGEVLTWIPGDGEYSLDDVLSSLPLLKDHDIVLVRRVSRDQTTRNLLSSAMYLLMRSMFRFDARDYCGIFLVSRSRFAELAVGSRDVFFTIEVALRARRRNWAIAYATAEWTPRRLGRSKVFNIRTIVRNLVELLRFRWSLLRGR